MKKALKIIGILLLILLTAVAVAWFGFLKPKPPPISDEDRALVHMMPLPAELKLGKGVFVLDNTLTHEFSGLSTPRLVRAVDRFYRKLSNQAGLSGKEDELSELYASASKSYGATNLPITQHVQKLVQSAMKK